VYTTEYADLFSNPEESGEFDVLMTGGRCVRCWVFMPSTAARNGNIVVVNKDIRKYTLAEPGAVFVRDEIKADGDQDDSKDKDTESAYSKAIALSNVNVNKTYVFIDADGNATGPFKIDSMVKIEGKRTRLKVDEVGRYDIVKRPSISNKSSRSWGTINGGDRCCPEHYSDWIRGVELADHKGVATTTDEDVLILPANWKALEVTSTASLGGKQNYTEEEALNNIFKLGTLTDIYASMTKLGMHKLTVANDDGLEFYFRLDDTCATRPHNYKAACISLVKDFGLDLEDADVMLKEAADSFKSKRLIKLAQQRSSLVGVDMPMPTDRAAGADPYTGTPVYGPDEQEMRGQMTNMPNIPDPDEYGINAPRRPQIDPNAQDMAAQAAQIGQKQVFDHAAIGGLSKLYDTGAVIDQYIPDFMKSLDRLGRILFLFYWKNADFAERYGTTDLAEMEDQLRGVFKNFGELVLQLRQRSIAGEDVSTIEA